MSKYLSNAKEKINNEKIEINKDGINVNKAKEIIYFLLATAPFTLILFLIEFLISIKIRTKKTNNNNKLKIKRI